MIYDYFVKYLSKFEENGKFFYFFKKFFQKSIDKLFFLYYTIITNKTWSY